MGDRHSPPALSAGAAIVGGSVQQGDIAMIMKHVLFSVGFAEGLFWMSVAALLVLQFLALRSIYRFYDRLRLRYPHVWEKVGKPTAPRGPRISEIRLTVFLRCGDFRRLGDKSLNSFYAKYAALRKVSFVPYALCFAGVLLFIWDKLAH